MDRVAIYTRVSTCEQDERSQRTDLETWLGGRGLSASETPWFRDKQSGTNMCRPDLDRLLDLARVGKVKHIVIWRLDRLGRTASGLTQLFDNLRAWECNLISLRDGIDLLTPAGRLMANVIASVAQYETEVRRERQEAGIRAAMRANGGKAHWGGYRGDRTYSKCQLSPEKRALIHEKRALGWTYTKIADLVGCSKGTVYRLTRLAKQAQAITTKEGQA